MSDAAARKILAVAGEMLSESEVEKVLRRVLDSAGELAGARFAAIGVLDEDRTKLARFLTAGLDGDALQRIGSLPSGRGVLGELIVNPVPLRIADLEGHPHSFGFPSGHPPMHTFLGVPIFIAGEPFGNIYLTEKQGGEQFTNEDEEALVLLAEFAGLAIDHAQRHADAATFRLELQRTVEGLDVTVQIAATLAGQTDLDLVLELLAKRGRALVSARWLMIELIDGDELLIAAGAGELPRAELIGRRIGMSAGFDQARFSAHALGHLGLQADAGLAVPLGLNGNGLGALVAVERLEDGPEFSAEDRRLLESFAAGAASAVSTAQSVAAERRGDRPVAVP